ncbi:helix-turn-helix domain-containing protein [Streptomyces anulatus]|uniref:helix-turn-helix domain-containing protein n=1 Tax=Streptomyces anulatus TaxID=1892 RepID=UPI00403DF027
MPHPLPDVDDPEAAEAAEAAEDIETFEEFSGADATFAAVFRQALRRRGLTLERIRDHLRAQQISVSLATLSHWQRGRSQPEKTQSLRAVDALEPLLDLPTGALRSSLGPHRPRGGVRPPDPAAARGVFGEDSDVEQALGDAFAHFNAGLRALTVQETVCLDERRAIRETSVTTVVQAVHDGVDHLGVVHFLDSPKAGTVALTAPGRPAPRIRFLEELGCVAADIPLGRRLARTETAVIAYTLRAEGGVSWQHERRVTVPLRAYLLHVRFHPEAVPTRCWGYRRERIGADPSHRHRTALDDFHTTHLMPARCVSGVYGIEWTWPD